MTFCTFLLISTALVFEKATVNIHDAGLILQFNDTFIQRLVPKTDEFFRQFFQQDGVRALMPANFQPEAVKTLTAPEFKLSLGHGTDESSDNTVFQLEAFGEMTLVYGVSCSAGTALDLAGLACISVSSCGQHTYLAADPVYGQICKCESGLVPGYSGTGESGCFCPDGGYFAPYGGSCISSCDLSTMLEDSTIRQCSCGLGLPIYFQDAVKCRAIGFCVSGPKLLELTYDDENNGICRCLSGYVPIAESTRCGCLDGKVPAPHSLGCIAAAEPTMDCSMIPCECKSDTPMYFQTAGICMKPSLCAGSKYMQREPIVEGSAVEVCRCGANYIVNGAKDDCACPVGMYLSPSGGYCIPGCDEASMVAVGLSCVCRDSAAVYFHAAKKCINYCTGTGYALDQDNVCSCATGFSVLQNYCVCSGGRYLTPVNECVQQCDASLTVNEEQRTCSCPATKPLYFVSGQKCVLQSACPTNGISQSSPPACGCGSLIYMTPSRMCASAALCSGAGMFLNGSVCSCAADTPYYFAALLQCVSSAQCTSMGAEVDIMLGSCICKTSLLTISVLGGRAQCGLVSSALCTTENGFALNATSSSCVCEGYISATQNTCIPRCGPGQMLAANGLQCVCQEGYLVEAPWGRACYDVCPAGFDVGSTDCSCPMGFYVSPSLDSCIDCTSASMTLVTLNSLSMCQCSPNTAYDHVTGSCLAVAVNPLESRRLQLEDELEKDPVALQQIEDPNPTLKLVVTLRLQMSFELTGLTYKEFELIATKDSEWGTTAALDTSGRTLIAQINSGAKIIPTLTSWVQVDAFKLSTQTVKLSDTTYIDIRPCGVAGYAETDWPRIQYNFINQICVATSSLSTAICKGTYVTNLRATAPEYIGPQPVQGFIRLAPLKLLIGTTKDPRLVYKGMALKTNVALVTAPTGIANLTIGPATRQGLKLSVQNVCQVSYDITGRPISCSASSINAGLLEATGITISYDIPIHVGTCKIVLFPASSRNTTEEWLWFGCSLQ